MVLWTNGQGVLDGDSYWFVPSEMPILCEYSISGKKICRVVFLEDCTAKYDSHYGLLKVGDKIILCPTRDMNIYVYDLLEDKQISIRILGEEDALEKLVVCAAYNDYVYFFPRVYPSIIRLNVNTMEVDYIKSGFVEKELEEHGRCTNYAAILDNNVFLTTLDSNRVCVFDMENETEYIKAIGNKDSRYKAICTNDDNQIVLVNQKGEMIFLDKELNVFKEKDIGSDEQIYDILCADSGYLLIPYNNKAQDIRYFNKDCSKEIHINYEVEKTTWSEKWSYSSFSRLAYDSNRIVFFSILNKELVIIDKKTLELSDYKIDFSGVDKSTINKLYDFILGQDILSEDNFPELSLGDYIDYMIDR